MKTRTNLIVACMVLAAGSHGFAAVRYVDVNSPSPSPPYTDRASAARVIQDAVDTAVAGDGVVVTNGTCDTGGRTVGTNILANRVAVDKPLTPRSVDGPHFTLILGWQTPKTTNGDGAVRCVYPSGGTGLPGFTLTNGTTRDAFDPSHPLNLPTEADCCGHWK